MSGTTPALFTVTASAQLISAALSAMSAKSSGSAYSQESYRSPFVPVVNVDTRRQAVVFSASLQWTDLSDEGVETTVEVEEPLQSASIVEVSSVVSKEDLPVSLGSDISTLHLLNDMEPSADNGIKSQVAMSTKSNTTWEASATKLKKKRSTEDASTSKRVSKHSKAFGKIMGRISLQPPKKELSERPQANTPIFNIVHMAPEYKLPELRTPGPLRVSFIAQPSPIPAVPALPAILPSRPNGTSSMENPPRLRLTIPTAGAQPSRSATPPPPYTPAHPAKKGHRRYKSSPAVTDFAFKRWDTENMPPLPVPVKPAPPAGAPMLKRGGVRGFGNTKLVVRAITPPFPPPRSRRPRP